MKKVLTVTVAVLLVVVLMGNAAGMQGPPEQARGPNQQATEKIPDHAEAKLPFLPEVEEVMGQVDGERIWEDTRAMSGAVEAWPNEYDYAGLNNPGSGADYGIRVASSKEEAQTAAWIEEQFREMGYNVEQQEFPYVGIVPYLHDGEYLLPVRAQRMGIDWDIFGEDGRVSVSGEISRVGTVCSDMDFDQIDFSDAEGKIALIELEDEWGGPFYSMDAYLDDLHDLGYDWVTPYSGLWSPDITEGLEKAQEAGAKALIVQNGGWRSWFDPRVSGIEVEIPFASVASYVGEDRLSDGVEVTLEVLVEDTSQNVIATREPLGGSDENTPMVIFCAHYDTVAAAPGASDNTSGTATLLEIARIFADYNLPVELRFAAVGAEEVGLIGSYYHAQSLTDEEIERTIGNWNFDMTGTAWPHTDHLFMATQGGETPEENVVAKNAVEAADILGFEKLIVVERGASDHVRYWQVGIEAANHIWREPETIDLEPIYHTSQDTMEFICPDRLEIATQIGIGGSYLAMLEEIHQVLSGLAPAGLN